jgi:predicted ATP-grasp superfamily ATP-dependent carboligase
MVRIGHYPLHHGTVGAIRSLGRLGVPVYAITEDRFTPAAVSRYLHGRIDWSTTGSEPTGELAERMASIAASLHRRTGRRAVAIATDDEAAVLLAEYAGPLGEHLRLTGVPPALPRALAGKQSLHELCVRHGVHSPRSELVRSGGQLAAAAAALDFPLVLKNDAPYGRLAAPAVSATTRVDDPEALFRLAAEWGGAAAHPSVLLQEYLPGEQAEDWIAHVYCPAPGAPGSSGGAAEPVVFTGVKVRSWPPTAGVTAHAYSAANPELAALTRRFCRAVGFRGIADLDWRLDLRDGRYKLLDFNPRLGAQFRLFESVDGVDLVRAQHLDLTGRPIPPGPSAEGRRFTVEILDLPARLAARGGWVAASVPRGRAVAPSEAGRAPVLSGRRELAWAALDDPRPALAAAARAVGPALRRLRRLLSRRLRVA